MRETISHASPFFYVEWGGGKERWVRFSAVRSVVSG
jgi:hypothetical protein